MKLLGHIALIAFVLQLTGIAGVCAPQQADQAHQCCAPSPQQAPPVDTDRTAQCCFVSALREHEAVAQTKAEFETVDVELPPAEGLLALATPSYQRNNLESWRVEHPPSPPIIPLRQTCLLLI